MKGIFDFLRYFSYIAPIAGKEIIFQCCRSLKRGLLYIGEINPSELLELPVQ